MVRFEEVEHSNNIRRKQYEASAPEEEFIVPLLKDRIEYYLKQYRATAGEKALDVGCGSQPFRAAIEGNAYQYFSLDVVKAGDKEVDFIFPIDKPVTSKILQHAPFNFILCTEVLEHIPKWDVVFENFKKMTKVGSHILLTCPHFYQLHEEPYDFWRPTPHALRFYAENHSFDVIALEKGGDSWDVLGTLLSNFKDFSAVRKTILNNVLVRVAFYLKNQLFKLLKNKSIQNRLKVHGPVYLSNIVILKRI